MNKQSKIKLKQSKIIIIAFCIVISSIVAIVNNNVKVEAKTTSKKCNTIIIGDSRIVGLASTDGVKTKNKGLEVDGYNKSETIYYKAKVGQGYKWFNETLDDIVKKCDEHTIVYVAFGVNDLYNVNKYKKLFNSLTDKLNGATIKIAEVGKVDEKKAKKNGYNVKQKDIDKFNKTIKKDAKNNDNYEYIDFWAGNECKKTIDGIHYNTDEYSKTLEKLK